MNFEIIHKKLAKGKYLYRYISFEKLIDFLETGELYLARQDTFEDCLESISPFDITELLITTITEIPEDGNPDFDWKSFILKNQEIKENIKIKLINRQKRRFVSSWVINDTESFGMWDIYAQTGFMIRFEKNYFENLIETQSKNNQINLTGIDYIHVGKIKYQNFEKIPFKEKKSLLKSSDFRKHSAFKYESEYRIVGILKMNFLIVRNYT